MKSPRHLPICVADLLNRNVVESERIEFKEGWNPEPILHTICAFANDLGNFGGGYIVIGVAEKNGQPVLPPKGVEKNQLDTIQKELLRLGHLIHPNYFPVLAVEELEGRAVVVLWCPGGAHRPYQASQSVGGKDVVLRHYVRQYSSTVVAKGDTLKTLISFSSEVPFDDLPAHRATLDDLSSNIAVGFLDSVGSNLAKEAHALTKEALFDRLQVLDGPKEHRVPKNVGLLFFSEAPHKYLRYAQIEVAIFPRGLADKEFEEQIFYGPVQKQIQDALDFINTRVIIEKVQKQEKSPRSIRSWSYPIKAVREALVNAVYHRSYEAREPVEVRVLPDKILIHSAPGPDRSISIEDLAEGKAQIRLYRNRRIGEFLKELELTEGRGTGIPLIQDELRRNGSPAVKFHTNEERTFFVTEIPIHPAFAAAPEVVRAHEGAQDRAQDGAQDLSSNELKVLEFCLNEARSTAEIEAHVGRGGRSGALKRSLDQLKDMGLIALTIPEKPTSRHQKRITTPQGAAFLAKRTGRRRGGKKQE